MFGIHAHGRHRAAPVAEFSPAELVPGTRWLVCDTTTCAHNTTRHIPHGIGWTCVACGTHKGDQ